MSKVKIVGNASGSGTLTLTGPNTNSDRTITLPDSTGTLLTEVADNAITLAKMAGGTDGNIISYDASGDPVAIATGSDGQVLTSTGAGSPPAFEAIPAADISEDMWFFALNTTTDWSSNSDIDFGSSRHLGGNLSESGGVITIGTAGMYLVTYSAVCPGSPNRGFNLNLFKNGSSMILGTYLYSGADSYSGREVTIPYQFAAGDTVKVYGTGHFYGNSQAMSRFVGTRIGD